MPTLDIIEILQRADDVARNIAAVNAEVTDQEAKWPEAAIRALQSACLGGLVVPESAGGLGYGLFGLAQVCEVLGQACASTALCFGMHCVGAAVIAAKATPDQRVRYLEPICAGKHLTTLALSEPGTGSHFYLPQTRLRETSPTACTVTGTKSFVTNGGHADSYVISTIAADPNAPPWQFSCAVVPEGAQGMAWTSSWLGMGMRGNSSRSVELQDVVVARRDLLGEEGDQLWYIFQIVAPYFLIAMAGSYLGIASAALEDARKHLSQRRYQHTGASLSQQSVLQHRLGTLWGQVERTRRLIYHAARSGDAGEEGALLALCSAKAEAADCAVNVTNEAMTLTGGMGYRDDSSLQRRLRDARASHVMAPTTDILRVWAGRTLLGLPLLGE